MSNFEKIPNRIKFLSPVACAVFAIVGARAIESEGAIQNRPIPVCGKAAAAFADYMSVEEKTNIHADTPKFVGKVEVSPVTDESGRVCPDKYKRVAKFVLKINDKPVPQVVGFMGNHVEDKAKIIGFATKEDCKGDAEVEAQGVYTAKVDLGNRTLREKYLSPVVKATC